MAWGLSAAMASSTRVEPTMASGASPGRGRAEGERPGLRRLCLEAAGVQGEDALLDLRGGPGIDADPAAGPIIVMGLRRHAVLEPEAQRRVLLHPRGLV